MSKNYTNYHKPNETKKQDEAEQTPVETAIETKVDPAVMGEHSVATVISEDEQSTTPEPEVVEPVIGVVHKCRMLNVRAEAEPKAEILTIINAGDEVEIIEEGSTDDFYHVIAGKDKEVPVEGYCVKHFVVIK